MDTSAKATLISTSASICLSVETVNVRLPPSVTDISAIVIVAESLSVTDTVAVLSAASGSRVISGSPVTLSRFRMTVSVSSTISSSVTLTLMVREVTPAANVTVPIPVPRSKLRPVPVIVPSSGESAVVDGSMAIWTTVSVELSAVSSTMNEPFVDGSAALLPFLMLAVAESSSVIVPVAVCDVTRLRSPWFPLTARLTINVSSASTIASTDMGTTIEPVAVVDPALNVICRAVLV